jgi:hypothetical protein
MKLSLKVSLIVGALVLLFMVGLARISDTIASGIKGGPSPDLFPDVGVVV